MWWRLVCTNFSWPRSSFESLCVLLQLFCPFSCLFGRRYFPSIDSLDDPCCPPYYLYLLKPWHRLCHLPSSPSPSSICHGCLSTGLVCTHVLCPFSPPLRCWMRVLLGYRLSPDIVVPLTPLAIERIFCHLCFPAFMSWRFSPCQRKTVCLKA